MTTKQCKFSMLCYHYYTFLSEFLNNCYKEKNVIWRSEHSMKALYYCAKIAQSKTIIRFEVIVFLFKSLNVFNLSAATENLITNYTFVNSFKTT